MPPLPRLKGLPASAGYAAGPVWRPAAAAAGVHAEAVSPGEEAQTLDAAIKAAIAQTAVLMERATGDAADIMEFQLAMLEDDSFRTAAAARIETGLSAAQAWSLALDAEIEGYLASDDEYFRARSADLADIRDRVLAQLTGAGAQDLPAGAIYVGRDILPSVFLAHDWTGGGIALEQGSATGHVAMLARQRGVPAVVGIGDNTLASGDMVLLDGVKGEIAVDPDGEERAAFEADRLGYLKGRQAAQTHARRPAATRDGVAVKVMVNIADPGEIDAIVVGHVDGVGLMRTEFLFGDGLPDEERQYAAYARVLEWAQGRPVTIRTVDAGGDKPVPGFTHEEANPFLGVRGIRLSLSRPEVFTVQIRALLRAAVHGNLQVMLPMISVPAEIDQALELFSRVAASLAGEGIAHAMPPIGIMVEVPSVAVTPERFSRAAFFSIGSNDLTQYVLAASRDNWRLSQIARPDDPSVLALIARVAAHGAASGRDVSLCGDAASDPQLVPALLRAGLRSLSVAASSIGEVKAAIAACDLAGGG